MARLSFSEVKLGDTLGRIEHEVTQEVVDRAALAHLDFNPVHTDIDWAARAQVFGTPKTVAHGMFTMSLMTSLVMRPWYERGVRVVRIEAKLTKPVPVGQSLSCEGSVKELHPRGPGSDLVVVGVTAYDSEGDTVGVGSITVRLPA